MKTLNSRLYGRLIVATACIGCIVTLQSASADDTTSPTAEQLMRTAHNARAVWHHFPGFSAEVVVRTNGVEKSGHVHVTADFSIDHDLVLEAADAWVSANFRSVIGHRRPSEFSQEGFAFVDQSVNNGRLVTRQDGSGMFRIADGVIREVHRRSDTRWLEITNLELTKTAEGQVLPKSTSVCYRDPASGNLLSQRSNTFAWQRVGGYDLPTRSLTVEVSEGGQRCVRELVLSNHKLASTSTESSDTATTPRIVLHKPLPESLTSFGAAVQDDYLYVFSGHSGDAHGFGSDLLVKHFRRIKFDDPRADWEELAMQPPAQSVAIVSDGEFIYRIAGLSFLNSGNEEKANFNSTNYFAKYDPSTDEWTELAPLPGPRSSLDAAIVGRSIFVAGGWNLQGKSSRDVPWYDDILEFDLDDPDSGWQSLPGPGYLTRAVSVAAHDDKLYVLGGIQKRGITRQVSVFDPMTSEWTKGPDLKADSSSAGFAVSAFATGGHLYYTGSSGVIYRLDSDANDWEVADRLMFPRMFLRLLPVRDNRLIALGGTGSVTGRTAVVESIRVDASADEDKLLSWTVPFSGRAKHSQSLLLDGTKLYAFGGNASSQPHDFSQEAFVDEAFVFDVTGQSVEQLPNLPMPMQSGAAVINSKTSEHETIVLTGGMGHVDGRHQALRTLLEFDTEANAWATLSTKSPAPRAMHAAVTHDDAIWVLGGSVVGEDRRHLDTVLHWWGDESPIAALPQTEIPSPRRSFGAAVLNRQAYLVGGLTAANGIAETVDVFNFEDRSWSHIPAPNVARVFPSVACADNKLYLFGGFSQSNGHFTPAATLEMFDPDTNMWATLTEHIPGVDPSMTMFSLSGRLLFYGIDKNSSQADFVLYDPAPMTQPAVVEGMSFSGRSGSAADKAEKSARMLMRKDTDKDGRLDASELGKRMADFFQRADSDTDSFLTLAEVVATLQADEIAAAASREEGREDKDSD